MTSQRPLVHGGGVDGWVAHYLAVEQGRFDEEWLEHRHPEHRPIRKLTCRLSGHREFTRKTFDWLIEWLLKKHGGDKVAVRSLLLSDVLELLEKQVPDTPEPLTERAELIYRKIVKRGPLTGPQICRDGGIEQSTLTKEIIPELKRLRGIVNKRGAGYYSPTHYTPQ